MTATLTLRDLPMSQDLDRAALNAILGGASRVSWEYLGSSQTTGSWDYTGNYSKVSMGNVYTSTHGWVTKYRTSYQYKQVNYKYNQYYEYWK